MEARRPPDDDPDAALMLRVKEGDEQAFRDLFGRYAGRLVAFADRFFHNRAIAEEIVQEVFLRVHRARKRYKPRARFQTWLYTIATRACLNELRRGVHRARYTQVDEESTRTAQPAADAQIDGWRLHHRVQAILDDLAPNQRAALLLVRFEGQSYSQVARILGVSEPAVKSLVFRATDAVRRGIGEKEREEDVP